LSVVVFGATGAIGESILRWFQSRNYNVIAVSRSRWPDGGGADIQQLAWDVGTASHVFQGIKAGKAAAVVWAQGVNLNDDIRSFDYEKHCQIYAANVAYIMASLQALLRQDCLGPGARLCVISSIWQNITRQNKLSYSVSKSALQGLIQSLAIDLGPEGFLVNAVLPGALDTAMTRANLSVAQIERLEGMTPLGKLSTLDDVCNLVGFLCSPANGSITGQFVAVDGGFSYAKIL
jgi:NAD(P)-dependent dehydrogenase (short-subunit alcohol dehydrogenase family)